MDLALIAGLLGDWEGPGMVLLCHWLESLAREWTTGGDSDEPAWRQLGFRAGFSAVPRPSAPLPPKDKTREGMAKQGAAERRDEQPPPARGRLTQRSKGVSVQLSWAGEQPRSRPAPLRRETYGAEVTVARSVCARSREECFDTKDCGRANVRVGGAGSNML